MTRHTHLDPYRDWAQQHGSGFGVTLWASPRSQQLRFEVMTQMCPLAGKRVLDAGCSRGDFAAFLIERGVQFRHYTGIDGLDEVIRFAAGRGLPRCDFHCGDFIDDPKLLSIGQPQVICISGSLNTMTDEQVFAVLKSAWAAASEALVFNFLSDRAKVSSRRQNLGPARRLDTLGLLDWAMEQTGSVAFRQDYFKAGHDATIAMRKESMDE